MGQIIFIMTASLVSVKKKCNVLSTSEDLHEQIQKQNSKNIYYYVFETVETKYFNEKVNHCHTTEQLV